MLETSGLTSLQMVTLLNVTLVAGLHNLTAHVEDASLATSSSALVLR